LSRRTPLSTWQGGGNPPCHAEHLLSTWQGEFPLLVMLNTHINMSRSGTTLLVTSNIPYRRGKEGTRTRTHHDKTVLAYREDATGKRGRVVDEGGWAVVPIPQKCMFFSFLLFIFTDFCIPASRTPVAHGEHTTNTKTHHQVCVFVFVVCPTLRLPPAHGKRENTPSRMCFRVHHVFPSCVPIIRLPPTQRRT
jgi:hypothetical protein